MRKPIVPFVAAVLLVALLVAGIIYWMKRDGRDDKKPLDADQKRELLRLKNEGLAHLEESSFNAAGADFQRIVETLPDDPMGHRNLVIALYRPSSEDGRSGQNDTARVVTAVQQLLKLDAGASASHFLAGLAYLRQAELVRGNDEAFHQARQRIIAHLKQAAQLSKDDPAPLYRLYDIEREWGDPLNISDETLAVLRSAAARAPDSLVISLEMAKHLALRQSLETREYLQKASKAMPAPQSGLGEKDDPHVILRRIIESVENDPKMLPPSVFQGINGTINLLSRHPAYVQERRRLVPHPLEFVQADFRPEFYQGLEEVAEGEPPIAVKFEVASTPEGKPGRRVLAAGFEAVSSDDDQFVPYYVVLSTSDGVSRLELTPAKEGPGFEGLEVKGEFSAFRLVDLDLDVRPRSGQKNLPADLDLVLYGPAGVRVFQNSSEGGRRHWIDRTSNLPALAGLRWLLVCDMDHEGNLDLIAGLEKGIRILRNRGDGSFDDITSRSPGLENLETKAAVYGDFDRDGDKDFMALSLEDCLVLLENRRSGRFAVQPIDGSFPGARCVHAADINNDGRLELLIGRDAGLTVLTRERDAGPFRVESKLGLVQPHPLLEIGDFDYDNDGKLDLWARTADPQRPLRIFRNLGFLFENMSHLLPAQAGSIDSVDPADVDDDGDIDLVLAGPNGVQVFRNEGGNRNHWIDIHLRAAFSTETEGGQAAKCNYFNVGGQVEIKSGLHYQMLPVAGPRTHFGLGRRKQVEAIRILWTNGVPQNIIRPQLDRVHAEDQRPKGSCPFLFTWDGTQFVMVTDCLWSSALGMQLAHGVLMDHRRQHNYLTIRDDQLKPRDGRYVLQFTNELWEVPYLDQAELWAIDHPEDIELHTNQAIPPRNEPFRLMPVRAKRSPVAARDHRGKDVLETIRQRDGRYLGGFGRRRYVGLAEPHWLELDLGDLSKSKQATLFLNGWIWPTDTSANVAISQDPRFRGPEGVVGGVQPPALFVPDGKAGWIAAMPSMGFPSGKLQTVAVDLPLEKFPPGDYRVRVATSMELYWDEVFFTADEPPVELEMKKLTVAEADLHYRGYSRVHQASRESPHMFDYHDADPAPRWLPMAGPYTRYGDVTELLHRPDSRYAVMSPGDELTLHFKALSAPPPGYRRTYVFYANGWLKDFDMNGEASDGAGPLPFEGMSRYPYKSGEEKAVSDDFNRFRRQYLNRDDESSRFWDALRPVPSR